MEVVHKIEEVGEEKGRNGRGESSSQEKKGDCSGRSFRPKKGGPRTHPKDGKILLEGNPSECLCLKSGVCSRRIFLAQ